MITTKEYPPKAWDVIGAITTVFGRDSLRNGWKIIEYDGTDTDEPGARRNVKDDKGELPANECR